MDYIKNCFIIALVEVLHANFFLYPGEKYFGKRLNQDRILVQSILSLLESNAFFFS